MYRFVDLSLGAPLPGAPVLGIEAAPEHVAQCTLGNIDGLHWGLSGMRAGLNCTGGHSFALPSSWRNRAAVDIATEIPLPPDGTALALGRVDLGTVAAAAILVLRKLNILHQVDFGAQGRIARIIDRATYRPSAEWAPRPLPTVEDPWPVEPHTFAEDRELAAVAAICGAPSISRITRSTAAGAPSDGPTILGEEIGVVAIGLTLAEQVAIVACWLLSGETWRPDAFTAARVVADACGVAANRSLAEALCDARARVEASRRALAEEAHRMGVIRAPARLGPSRLVIVRSMHHDAPELGFCMAPVVVWWNSMGMVGQWAIAAWASPDGQTQYLDVDALHERLWRADERWTSAASTCVSPEGGTHLSEETLVREVLACLS